MLKFFKINDRIYNLKELKYIELVERSIDGRKRPVLKLSFYGFPDVYVVEKAYHPFHGFHQFLDHRNNDIFFDFDHELMNYYDDYDMAQIEDYFSNEPSFDSPYSEVYDE